MAEVHAVDEPGDARLAVGRQLVRQGTKAGRSHVFGHVAVARLGHAEEVAVVVVAEADARVRVLAHEARRAGERALVQGDVLPAAPVVDEVAQHDGRVGGTRCQDGVRGVEHVRLQMDVRDDKKPHWAQPPIETSGKVVGVTIGDASDSEKRS